MQDRPSDIIRRANNIRTVFFMLLILADVVALCGSFESSARSKKYNDLINQNPNCSNPGQTTFANNENSFWVECEPLFSARTQARSDTSFYDNVVNAIGLFTLLNCLYSRRSASDDILPEPLDDAPIAIQIAPLEANIVVEEKLTEAKISVDINTDEVELTPIFHNQPPSPRHSPSSTPRNYSQRLWQDAEPLDTLLLNPGTNQEANNSPGNNPK